MFRGNKSIFILLFFPLFIFSQKIDSAYVDSINQQVQMLRYDGKFDEAYTMVNDLIFSLEKSTYVDIFYANAYYTKSRIEIELGEYDKAFDNSRKAFQLYLKNKDSIGIAQVYNLFGVGHYYKNQLDSTIIYYQKSFDLKKTLDFNDEGMAVSAYNLAMVYEDTGFFDEAMDLYFEAEKHLLKIKEELLLKEKKEYVSFLPDVYIGIAHLYRYKKDFEQAEKFADKAMDIGLKGYGEFNPNMTFVYTSYANILESKKKYKESIKLLKKSLKIRETVYGKQHRWTCESYSDLGQVYVLDKQFDQAERCYRKAINIGTKSESKLYLADAKASLAYMYCDRNINSKEVEKLLKESLLIYKSIYGEKNDIITKACYYLAKNSKNKNNEQTFFSYLDDAFIAGNYNKHNLNKTIAPFQVLDALVLESDWYEQEYQKTKFNVWLTKKFDLLDKQISLINFLQKNYSSEISKISFANDYRTVFEKGLNVCWNLYYKTQDFKYLEKAFQLSETNRNTILLEGLQDIVYKLHSDIPKEILIYEKQIQEQLAKVKMDLYYEKNSSNPEKEKLSNLISKRIVISIKLDSLKKKIIKNYPKYEELKYNKKSIDISDIQNNLDSKTQLITYFLGDKDLYTFNITKDKVIFLKNDIAEKIVKKINTLKIELLSQQNIEETGKELYRYLLDKQLNFSKKNLIIIPDNILNYIPFEILKNSNNEVLIQNFEISYSGSVRLYSELNNDFFDYDMPNYWTGFSSNSNLNSSLSSNNKEIYEIGNLINGNIFLGKHSSKANFLNNLNNSSILHLAMHAEINNENPLYNKLIFSDGEVTSSEIYVSDIKANLAVLSACNTGFGILEKGEGVMSMARAFNYSGVPAVIMSLWKVPDKEAKTIMVGFYKHLKEGETKSEALRNAKLDYLANTTDNNLKHPFYWSGFILNGNTNKLPPKDNYKYYLLGGVLLFGLVVFGIKRKFYSK